MPKEVMLVLIQVKTGKTGRCLSDMVQAAFPIPVRKDELVRAVVSARYGSPDILQILQVARTEPRAGELLIRVHATTVSRTDCGMLRPHPFFIRLVSGLLRPKRTILGMDFAGVVEAVGTGVTSFVPGDRVFGLSPDAFGAHADYLCVAEDGVLATMPEGLDFAEAVLCEGAWYADTYLKRFDLKPGHKIMIYGGSGAIGTAAVQLAKYYGAEVTAIVSSQHLKLVKSLGADRVIDYTAGDFTQIDESFDFVFDAVGKTSYFRCRELLTPDGVFSATDLGPWWQNIFLEVWFRITRSRRVVFPMPKASRAVVDFVKARMEAGQLRAVIDRRYPLEAVADAYRYVESAQKTGIVVIDVA